MLLESRIKALEEVLRLGEQLGPSHDMPFAILLYDPQEELELRRQVKLLDTRLQQQGLHVEGVDLGGLMWTCFEDHPMGSEGLLSSEAGARNVNELLREGNRLLMGRQADQPGPLEEMVIDLLAPYNKDPEAVAFLTRAGELFPFYRTSALLERLMRHVKVRTVLYYPGTLEGATSLSFMGVCEPSPNYRPRIFA